VAANTEVGEQHKEAPAHPRMRASLAVDHLFGSLGLFMLFPVMGVLLAARTSGNTAVVGIGLFCYTASAGLSALLANRWLSRITYRTGMIWSVLVSALAFGLLPYVSGALALCGLLLLAGLGVSVHFVLSRVLIAEVVSSDIGRNNIYSLLQVMVNVAATVGPFVASYLYTGGDARLLLGLVAGAYVLAGLSILPGVPGALKAPPTSGRWPISASTIRSIGRTPVTRRTVVIGTLGAFVYAQFFSGFALLVAGSFASPSLRAALLAGPAMFIVLFQTAVTALVRSKMAAGTAPFAVLAYATVVFGVAMVLLGVGLPMVVAACGAVLVFSVAEMLFTPMMSTAFAALPIESKLEAFNLRQVCWTSGEALGSLAGGSLFLALWENGAGQAYWLTLSVLTLVVSVPMVLRTRKATADERR
jgi:MFS family permease